MDLWTNPGWKGHTLQGQRQVNKDLPRIRVRSRFSETGEQRHEIRRSPAFNMQYDVRRTAHRRRNVRALTITLIVHLIAAFFVIQSIREHTVEEDAIQIEWVELPPPPRTLVRPRQTQQVKDRSDTETVSTRAEVVIPALSSANTQELPPLETDGPPGLRVAELERDLPDSPIESRFEQGGYTRSPHGRDTSMPIIDSTDKENLTLAPDEALELEDKTLVSEDRLGAVLEGEGMEIRGHIRLIRLKHSLSDWWQDPSAIPSFAKWLEENTDLRADMEYAGGALPLTDPRILSAPMVIMTGHDKDVTVGRNLATPNRKNAPLAPHFTSAERAALRKYIVERGGMLFFDDCGFNGTLAATVQHELTRIFPEYYLENLMHDHEIYSIYYDLPRPPTGGDVFWRSENHPKPSQFKYQKGITINNRLGVVYNRKDYLCAMETVEIPSRTMLRMRRSKDVHRFMTNLLIYTMMYGGNTDRSGYKR